jgi:hypothetical protein
MHLSRAIERNDAWWRNHVKVAGIVMYDNGNIFHVRKNDKLGQPPPIESGRGAMRLAGSLSRST